MDLPSEFSSRNIQYFVKEAFPSKRSVAKRPNRWLTDLMRYRRELYSASKPKTL
jgi:hypothetical protein